MSFAVIKTGGKQYLVSEGKKLKIEKLETEEGKEVVFNEVLLLEGKNKLEIGSPLLTGAKVTGKVLKQGRADKIVVFKYKPKKRYKKKQGHRQSFTEVEITRVN